MPRDSPGAIYDSIIDCKQMMIMDIFWEALEQLMWCEAKLEHAVQRGGRESDMDNMTDRRYRLNLLKDEDPEDPGHLEFGTKSQGEVRFPGVVSAAPAQGSLGEKGGRGKRERERGSAHTALMHVCLYRSI